MKTPGRLVSYTNKENKSKYGRTYNNENYVNGKVVVHLMNDDLELIKENGKDKKVLVDAKKLTMQGFID